MKKVEFESEQDEQGRDFQEKRLGWIEKAALKIQNAMFGECNFEDEQYQDD